MVFLIPKQLREFIVMDIEKCDGKPHVFGASSNKVGIKWVFKNNSNDIIVFLII